MKTSDLRGDGRTRVSMLYYTGIPFAFFFFFSLRLPIVEKKAHLCVCSRRLFVIDRAVIHRSVVHVRVLQVTAFRVTARRRRFVRLKIIDTRHTLL